MSCPKNCQKKRQTNKIGVDFQQTANGRASLFVAKHKAWPMVHPSCMMKAAPTSGGGEGETYHDTSLYRMAQPLLFSFCGNLRLSGQAQLMAAPSYLNTPTS